MFNFGLSQKLSSLLFLSIGVSILLGLSLSAEAAVNSPTLTILDMEEMSQIAGGGRCVNLFRLYLVRGPDSVGLMEVFVLAICNVGILNTLKFSQRSTAKTHKQAMTDVGVGPMVSRGRHIIVGMSDVKKPIGNLPVCASARLRVAAGSGSASDVTLETIVLEYSLAMEVYS